MLTDLYQTLRNSAHLVGVLQEWGRPFGPQSTPRICWVPTNDAYLSPEQENVAAIVSGERVQLRQIAERRAGCELWILAEGAEEQAAREVEQLLVRVARAIEEAGALHEIRLVESRWLTQEIPETHTGYALGLVLQVPIYKQQPAARALAQTTTTAAR